MGFDTLYLNEDQSFNIYYLQWLLEYCTAYPHLQVTIGVNQDEISVKAKRK